MRNAGKLSLSNKIVLKKTINILLGQYCFSGRRCFSQPVQNQPISLSYFQNYSNQFY